MELEEVEDFIIDAISFLDEKGRKFRIEVMKPSWLDLLLSYYFFFIFERNAKFFFFFDESSQAVSLSRKR